jgi:hypothetical protein
MPTFTSNGGNADGIVGTTTSHAFSGVVGANTDITPKGTAAPSGNGVGGVTMVPDGAGVMGLHAGAGLGVSGVGLIGVWGGSFNGVGVLGVSAPAGMKGGDGVQGITNSEQRNGVYGRNDSTTARGGAAPLGNGVMGYTRVPDGAGVMGVSGAGGIGVQGSSSGHGVLGQGGFGVTGRGTIIGVWGIADGAGWAGQFTGPVLVSGTLTADHPSGEAVHASTSSMDVAAVAAYQTNPASGSAALYAKHFGGKGSPAAFFDGSVVVTGDIVLIDAADCAEEFDVADLQQAEPGTLMIMGEEGVLEPCASAYDHRSVGVVSGADNYRPGLVLDRQPGGIRRPIALMGKVACKVDADHGAIAAGDLLTSSPTPGHAMRVADRHAAFGAVIGKALRPLAAGRGMIPVLVTLQ